MTIQRTTAKDIVQIIKNKRDEVRFAVLLGAGASVTAGIPLASEMIKELKKKIYERETGSSSASDDEIDGWIKKQDWYKAIPSEELYDREYSTVFEKYALSRPDGQAYISECVKRAKAPNWAHIYLAHLVKHNCIQTILTTNFDDLAFKALFQQGQEVVTCHRREHFNDVLFSSECPAIIHLHGHYLNYDIKNLEEEVNNLPKEFVNLFRNVVSECGLIVVGYGGRKEFVMELLQMFAKEEHFRHNLYWVANGGEGTLNNRTRELLEYRRSYLIEECDADSFFLQLNHGLDLGFPPFLLDPLGNLIETLKPLQSLELQRTRELGQTAHGWLISKIEKLETFHGSEKEREEAAELTNKFLLLYEQGKIEEAEKQLISAIEKSKEDAFLYFAYGTLLSELGGEENLRQSFEKYKLAVKYKPDDHEAYNNWGNALLNLGTMLGGEEGQGLIRESFEKYKLAVTYKPDLHEAYNNWGVATQELADLLPPEEKKEKESLKKQAEELLGKAKDLREKPE